MSNYEYFVELPAFNLGRLLQRAFQQSTDADNSFTPIGSDELSAILFLNVVSIEQLERHLEDTPEVRRFLGEIHTGVVITLENCSKYLIHICPAINEPVHMSKKFVRFCEMGEQIQNDSELDHSESPVKEAHDNVENVTLVVTSFRNVGSGWKCVASSAKPVRKSKVVHFIEACGSSYQFSTETGKEATHRMMMLQ